MKITIDTSVPLSALDRGLLRQLLADQDQAEAPAPAKKAPAKKAPAKKAPAKKATDAPSKPSEQGTGADTPEESSQGAGDTVASPEELSEALALAVSEATEILGQGGGDRIRSALQTVGADRVSDLGTVAQITQFRELIAKKK